MVMNPAERGERYARIFRKAGAFLAKGNIEHAVAVLKEGQDLATELGDTKMSDRFAREIATVSAPASGGK
jgi:hypothetical protein